MTDTATDTAPPETVSLPCLEDGCEFVAVGPDTGPGSARFLLGSHKFREHGVQGEGKNAKRKRRTRGGPTVPSDEDAAAHPIISSIRDAASEIGGKGVPSADDLGRAFGRGLSYVSIAVASYAVEVDPTIPDGPAGEARREALVDDLSVPQRPAQDIMAPLGRLLAPTKLNHRFGRATVENVDVVASLAEVATIAMRWRRYFREQRLMIAQGHGVPIEVTGTPVPTPNGNVPTHSPTAGIPLAVVPTADGEGVQSPPPTQGMVMDAETVRSMRRHG